MAKAASATAHAAQNESLLVHQADSDDLAVDRHTNLRDVDF